MLMQLQQHSHCMNNLTAARGELSALTVVVVCVRVAERSLYIVNNEVVNNGNPGADVLYMQLLFSFFFFFFYFLKMFFFFFFSFFKMFVCLFICFAYLAPVVEILGCYVWTPVAAGCWMLLSHRVYPHQSNVVAYTIQYSSVPFHTSVSLSLSLSLLFKKLLIPM